tara:strand:- start:1044 stop:2135 length:1092 start_codon:yes stop_codon:yes gene_type:complete
MNKKNLVFFLPNFTQGGAGQSILNICKNLSKNKYKIYVISLTENFYQKELKKYCKEIIEINARSSFISLSKIKFYLRNFDRKNTLLISNINYANALFTIYFKIFNNFKLALIERTPLQELFIYFGIKDKFKKFVIKFIIKYFYRFSDTIIANSKKTADDFSIFVKKKCMFIYPLTIEKILKFKKRSLINKRKITLVSIGRLSQEKNYEEILLALKILRNNGVTLKIIGNGAMKSKLTSVIKKNKISATIQKYTNNNKKKALNTGHIYICCSLFEGFPNAVVEAINHNIPIISSNNHGGINEILLNGKGGEIYQSGNSYELANKIKHVIKHYDKSLKKTIIAKNSLYRFSKKNIKKYEKIFDKI